MSDFFQNGIITTLHNLSDRPIASLEDELCGFAEQRPMALVLPCLYSELATPALAKIVEELARVPYLEEIIIGLDQASEAEYHHALEYFSVLVLCMPLAWRR